MGGAKTGFREVEALALPPFCFRPAILTLCKPSKASHRCNNFILNNPIRQFLGHHLQMGHGSL